MGERAIAAGQRWLDRAAAAQSEGEADVALDAASRALRALRRGLGPGDPNLAPALVTLGHLHADRDEPRAAVRRYEAAVRLLAPLRRDEDALSLEIETRVALAHALIALARYDEAAALSRQTLSVASRRRGPGSVEVARACNALGVGCKYTGRFGLGVRYYTRALAIVEAVEPDSDEMIAVLHNLGGIHHAAGDYASAEPFARRALAFRQERDGVESLAVAVELSALAPILDGLGRGDEAAVLQRQAAEVFRREGRVYDLAVALHNLAEHEPDPEATYREALALKVSLFGRAHPDVALTLHNLGVWLATRRPKEAQQIAVEAHAILLRTLGARHPHTRAAQRAVGLGQGQVPG